MDKKELKNILSSFSATAGGQLKYYFVKSLFPDITDSELRDICGINPRSFSDIKKVMTERELPLLKFDNCADTTSTTSLADEELQSKFDRLEEELKAARETILHLKDEMEEKDFLYSKSKSGYMEENVSLRKDVEYLKCELKKKEAVEPLQFRITNPKVRLRTPEPVLTPEELEG